jgi:hypothetical protein
MKMNTTLLFGLGLCGALLAACSSSDHPDASLPPVAIPQTPQSLETAQVLSLAEKPSETGSPFAVNGGLITLTDTSETASPIAVNGAM